MDLTSALEGLLRKVTLCFDYCSSKTGPLQSKHLGNHPWTSVVIYRLDFSKTATNDREKQIRTRRNQFRRNVKLSEKFLANLENFISPLFDHSFRELVGQIYQPWSVQKKHNVYLITQTRSKIKYCHGTRLGRVLLSQKSAQDRYAKVRNSHYVCRSAGSNQKLENSWTDPGAL